MTPLTVLHVIDSLDPAAGGPPVIAWSLALAQARAGHAVTVAAAAGVAEGTRLLPGAGRPHAVKAVALPPARWAAAAAGAGGAAARAVAELVGAADVVHLHGVWDAPLILAARAARAAGRPYVVAPHGMLDPWSLRQRAWKKKAALAVGWRRMLDRAAALHLLNSDEAALVAPLGLRAPAAVVPNGVDLADLDPLPGPDEFRRTRPELAGRPYVLFLSRLHYKKGLDYLADAFAAVAPRFPGVDLVVAGPDGGAEADFRRRVAAAGLAGRVHLTGPVYGADKWAALAGAACFCLPSRQEGFSVAILEALACRVPVVISDNCHFPEVAGAGAGEVVPLAAGAVADALARVLADPGRAAGMGRAGRALVEERYTWDKVAGECGKMYAAAVGARAAAAALAARRRSPWGFRDKVARVVWGLTEKTLFRLSPRPLYRWRAWLLRRFGARVHPRARVRSTVTVTIPWHLAVGADTVVGDHVILYCLGPVTLGDRVTVSQYSHLCAGTHDYADPAFPLVRPPIVVEDDAWLAADVFVGPGVRVGRGAVVGARASVFADLPAGTVCVGNPARPVKPRPGFAGPSAP